ncbi:MAG: hypothetical protein HRU77_10165 [Gammaproteobacteria bacterium]|jgi:hypothetical protein|nr:hypothetical protein [Pseudomonadota bacterium]QOJ21025.1 MAG: hypothetical protein HRU77_10165 [Gammaproteobacteria bacterium]
MRKVFFGLTLMFVSTNTMAEWTRIGESDRKGGYTLYADTASIRKAAGRAKMAILFDYQTLQKAAGAEFLSEKIRREYECQEKQIRTLAYSLFSLHKEHGDLVRSYNQPQKWEMVKPDSLEEVEWKVACSEK